MLLLAPARIADGLRDGTLPERSKFHLLLLTSVLGLLFGRRTPTFRTYGDLVLIGLFLAVALLGLWSCYRANGGANGRAIVERFICLGVPVGIWLYGGYYLLYYGSYLLFRPSVAGAGPHLSSRLNGWSVATSFMAMVVYYWILSRYIRRSAGLVEHPSGA
jgi:hypothetical protein